MASHASAATLCEMSGDSSLRAVASGAVGGAVDTSPSQAWLGAGEHFGLFKATGVFSGKTGTF